MIGRTAIVSSWARRGSPPCVLGRQRWKRRLDGCRRACRISPTRGSRQARRWAADRRSSTVGRSWPTWPLGWLILRPAAGLIMTRCSTPRRLPRRSPRRSRTCSSTAVFFDPGVLHDDDRLADWWPAFAAHGKDVLTIRHVLTHTAGTPAVPADTTVDDLPRAAGRGDRRRCWPDTTPAAAGVRLAW